LDKVIQNLEVQGFGVVTTIDVQETFQEKLNLPFRNYKILGAYNARFAYKAITMESHAGVSLLCNVIVQEHENGEVEISAINPLENFMSPFSTTHHLANLANELGIRLRAALDYLYHDLSNMHDEALPLEDFRMSDIIQG